MTDKEYKERSEAIRYPSNSICPKCHKSGYVYYLEDSDYVAKCFNCNYQITREEFPLWKDGWTRTNADRIRAMTDEELAKWMVIINSSFPQSAQQWLDWLRKEASDE